MRFHTMESYIVLSDSYFLFTIGILQQKVDVVAMIRCTVHIVSGHDGLSTDKRSYSNFSAIKINARRKDATWLPLYH